MEFNAEETAIVSTASEVTKVKMIFNEITSQLTVWLAASSSVTAATTFKKIIITL